jgi:glycosyltransferase involved in cell wall biosynthesis
MNILYIHQYFKTPNEPGGTRSYWIAKELIKSGHQVTMLTTSSSINRKVERKNIDGIDVIYLKIPYDQKMGIFKRLLSFVSFMFKSTWIAFKQKKINLVIATSTPLTVGFPALILKKFKRIPYVFEVRDLWPEVPIQMGAIKNKILIKLLNWFEKTIYKNAVHVIALSPGMMDGVVKKLKSDSKVSMIPNMAKIDEFYPRPKSKESFIKYNLNESTFKAIHFGSLGLANGAEYIIEAAKSCKEDKTIEFIFIGGGSTEESLKNLCKSYGLENVKFLGAFSMKDTSEIVNICDVSVVTFSNIPILYTNSPNKLFDSLSAGKPIIVNSPGWTKDLVEKERCGFYSDINNSVELIDKINILRMNSELFEEYSLNSRKLAENTFDKSILTVQFCDVIKSLGC